MLVESLLGSDYPEGFRRLRSLIGTLPAWPDLEVGIIKVWKNPVDSVLIRVLSTVVEDSIQSKAFFVVMLHSAEKLR